MHNTQIPCAEVEIALYSSYGAERRSRRHRLEQYDWTFVVSWCASVRALVGINQLLQFRRETFHMVNDTIHVFAEGILDDVVLGVLRHAVSRLYENNPHISRCHERRGRGRALPLHSNVGIR